MTGINFDAVSDYRIERVSITNCGVMRKGDTRDDGYHGGFGILITAQGGATRRGYLEKCAVSKIAGGGYFRGDGIYFGGNGSNEVNAVVRDCRVDEVGRHAFTVTSANGKALESNSVVFSGCTGSRTALSGLDVEGAGRVRVDRCCFERCGVDTKYYDAERVYGSEYRLMAGIACSNDDFQVIISDSQIDNSYYGITYGAVSELKIERVTVRNSSKADLALRLANGPKRALFNELQCLSSIGVQLGSTFANRELLVRRCIFAGPVKISGPGGGEFSRCDFQEGFRIAGRNVTLLRFFDCDFYARRGPGIGFDVPFARSSDCEVRACRFLGRDKMTFGIEFSPEAARRWSIIDSRFVGQSVAPLNITAEEAERSMITISSTVSLESPR